MWGVGQGQEQAERGMGEGGNGWDWEWEVEGQIIRGLIFNHHHRLVNALWV